jgi:hypothetical protein
MQQQQRVLVKAEHKSMDWGFYLWLLYRRLPLIIVLVVLALIAVGILRLHEPKVLRSGQPRQVAQAIASTVVRSCITATTN